MTRWVSPDGAIDLRLGRWQDVLADVDKCDAVICDPPYLSAAADAGGSPFKRVVTPVGTSVMGYAPATAQSLTDVARFSVCSSGWCVFFNDFDGAHTLRAELLLMRAVVAEPIAWVKPPALTPPRGIHVLPQKGTEFIVCARHVRLTAWHTHLPGAYVGPAGFKPVEQTVVGGKPVDIMRAIVRDYSRPGDLVVDPFCGGGTTALACAIEGRRCITSEMDPVTFEKARARLAQGYTRDMFAG